MSDFSKMPPELLEIIFLHLDSQKEVLKLTQTCKKFKEIVESSEKLLNKITLHVEYPIELKSSFNTVMSNSDRQYKNLYITKSVCYGPHSLVKTEEDDSSREEDRIFESSIGPSIKNLTLNWSNSKLREAFLVDMIVRRARPRAEAYEMNHHQFNEINGMMNHVHHLANREDLERNQVDRVHAQIAETRNQVQNEVLREFIDLLDQFKNLQKMTWLNVQLEKIVQSRYAISIDLSSVQELKMSQCDGFCFHLLTSCKQLKKLEISEPIWGNSRSIGGVELFENFLLEQTNLKTLILKNIHYPCLFQVDKTDNIKFKLNHLVLKNVFFKDKTIAENFFKTQDELQSITFQLQNERSRNLDEMLWYNDILKIGKFFSHFFYSLKQLLLFFFLVLGQNLNLRTVNIEKLNYNIENYDFLKNIINPNVSVLNFKVTAEDKDAKLFKVLIRKLPNLSNITFQSEESEDNINLVCFDKNTSLKKVRKLKIVNSSVNSLINFKAENLVQFEYAPGKTGAYIDDIFGKFMHSHRNLKHLTIGTKNCRSYFFVSYNLCQIIASFFSKLESITIYNFAEVNKSVKLFSTLRNLKSLTLSSAQFQQFTAKTKVECERMKLKLIPVTIEPTKTKSVQDSRNFN